MRKVDGGYDHITCPEDFIPWTVVMIEPINTTEAIITLTKVSATRFDDLGEPLVIIKKVISEGYYLPLEVVYYRRKSK